MSKNNKNLIITGANGFIGNQLVKEALNNNYCVYACVRKSSDTSKLPLNNENILRFDYLNSKSLQEEFSKLKTKGEKWYFIHNAGQVKALNQKQYMVGNLDTTKNIVSAILKSGLPIKKLIYTSSLAANGPGTSNKTTNNNKTANPVDNYGISKLEAENFLKSQNIPYLILRPPGVYGPADINFLILIKAINKGFETYFTKETQITSLIHVNDLAAMYIKALSTEIENTVFFASDGEIYELSKFYQIVSELLGKKTKKIFIPIGILKAYTFIKDPINALMKRTSILNADKIKSIKHPNWSCDGKSFLEAIEYTPKYSLEEGLRETIEWYKKNKWI